ncbi:hypothetical protein VMCG_10604 [Cytospora schulzeri]|uniref:Thioester reductase (TE) domain-containing protein n=1 Tax=Cytospora schulzeri TaxID=448051 RepID=A0A423V9V9_9PEZI|nr:hypothetical protein VMCG_10604 [Valsa malicola]
MNNANIIMHNGWRVDFSWTIDLYKGTYLRSVRNLVELLLTSPLRPRITFVSSVSSVQEWTAVFPDRPVAEAPLESYEVASPFGYGLSKHVAERVLARASEVSGTPVTILPVGQVAGPTDPNNGGGIWSTDEWIPSVAAISKTLRLIPADIPPIDWLPVDLAARAIIELALIGSNVDSVSENQSPLRVFNVVNPTLSDWSLFARALQSRLDRNLGEGEICCRLLPLTEWVDALR